jgi:hypothetical protein
MKQEKRISTILEGPTAEQGSELTEVNSLAEPAI